MAETKKTSAKERKQTRTKPAAAKKGKTAEATQILNCAFIWDMSGSMGVVWDAAIEGFNDYVRDLKDDEDSDTTRFSLTVFDTVFEKWYMDEPVSKIPAITHNRYAPRGGTALFDAIAHTITDLDTLLVGDRSDEKVLVVVLTDGQENSSRDYSLRDNGQQRIAELVGRYEKKGWTFVYLGTEANIQASQHVAASMGVAAGNVANWSRDATSTSATYSSLSSMTKARKASNLLSTDSAFADAGLSQEYATPGGTVEPSPSSSVAPPKNPDATITSSSLSDALGGGKETI